MKKKIAHSKVLVPQLRSFLQKFLNNMCLTTHFTRLLQFNFDYNKNFFQFFYPMINFTCWNRSRNTKCWCSIKTIIYRSCHSWTKYSFKFGKYISSTWTSCSISSLSMIWFIKWIILCCIITICYWITWIKRMFARWNWRTIIFNCIRPFRLLDLSIMKKAIYIYIYIYILFIN